MNALAVVENASLRLPTVRSSDWFLRIPVALIIIEQGFMKVPDFAGQAEGYGIPVALFGLALFAEVAGGIALLIGGLLRNNWFFDAVTRLGGLAISIVVAGVIAMLYFGPFSGWQFQGLLLAAGLYFLLRGNGDVRGRAVI
ncbi:MAG: hypothetical protein AAFO79_01785 [Pseudomonadota bacterium]